MTEETAQQDAEQEPAAFDSNHGIEIDDQGATWMHFDGIELANHSDGQSLMVIFGLDSTANFVMRIPNMQIINTAEPDKGVLTLKGFEGRQRVFPKTEGPTQ